MSDIVIKAENLGKKYRIGHQAESGRYTALRDVLMENARGVWNKTRDMFTGMPVVQGDTHEDIWTLKDVNFEIRRGEAVGIIGRNGAGKSTLLKILSRITEPTEGRVTIRGRVASLLEVGTGFHPELTGRENIYLNGAILGMSRAEIKRKFDEIVAFAEVEKYLDTPIKRYSSGMYVRLAFAVAANLEPEILVVDEVLAVGDAAFQKKCLGKMGDVEKEGRTVLFVSHNMAAIRVLCSRSILLSRGYVEKDGSSAQVLNTYLDSGSQGKADRHWDDPKELPEYELVRLRSVCVRDESGLKIRRIGSDNLFYIEIEYWNLKPGNRLGTTVVLFNQEGTCVLSSISNHEAKWHGKDRPAGLFRSTCQMPCSFLNEGCYKVTVIIFADHPGFSVLKEDECIEFEVYDTGGVRGDYYGGWSGVVRPILQWHTEQLNTGQLVLENG